MNVLLLTADSLRADRTSLFGHSRDTTPFLAYLAADGFEFRRAYTNGFNTSSSFPAVHTSTHQSYYEGLGIPDSGTPTLAEILSVADYATHAVHTNELLSRNYNYARGFDVYRDSRTDDDDEGDGSSGDGGGWRTTARDAIGDGILFEIVKHAHFLSTEYLGVKIFDTADAVSGFTDDVVSWATDAEGDWFTWAHYMNPHHPYEPPVDCQEALGLDPVPKRRATRLSRKMRLHPEDVTVDERETLRDLYDASILSWDRELESVVECLDEVGELADTLVVVSADHGELLGKDGLYGHPPCLRQPLLRVPLVFFGGPVAAGESDAQVGLVDLAPTLVRLVGATVPDGWHGRPLFKGDGSPRDLDHTLQFAEVDSEEHPHVGVVNDDRKVVHEVAADEWTGYELADEHRLRESETDEPAADLQDAVEVHEATAAENRERAATVDEDRLREDLAALGYLDK